MAARAHFTERTWSLTPAVARPSITRPALREASPLTHIEALELDHIPRHLLVLGGGYIGLELSQAMRRFGSEVTIVERNGHLAHREDEDVTQALEELFRDEGIDRRHEHED